MCSNRAVVIIFILVLDYNCAWMVEAHIPPYGKNDGFGVIARSCAPWQELFNGPLFDLWGSKLAEI
jgi:hypothetical protein